MKVGDFEIRVDKGGTGYVVGKPVEYTRKGKGPEIKITSPKYYATITAALESLPERMVKERLNFCSDLAELREMMRQAAEKLLEPASEAVGSRVGGVVGGTGGDTDPAAGAGG